MATPRKKNPQKAGRKTGYAKAYASIARQRTRSGATLFEIATELNVSLPTIFRWANQFPEFRDSIVLGRSEGGDRSVRSLFERANGYTYEVEKIGFYKGRVVRAKTWEHVPPDVTALSFWLRNRDPDHWRERQELDQRIETVRDGPTNRDIAKALALLMEEARIQKARLIEGSIKESDDGKDQGNGGLRRRDDDRGPGNGSGNGSGNRS